MMEARLLTAAELNGGARERASTMLVTLERVPEERRPIGWTHALADLASPRGAAEALLWTREGRTYYSVGCAPAYCTCPWWVHKCQALDASCKHIEWLREFLADLTPEDLARLFPRMLEVSAEERAERREAAAAEVAGVFA